MTGVPTAAVIGALGGLGLFLIGMLTMTQGLRSMAGESLQRGLRRFTRSPASGALTGTLATALVQSSSATTVTAVGFAGAGLLSFPEALGIVFGANVGTTITGWMVALFGFKLKLGLVMPLAVLAGALMRLFGRGRWASAGSALAGFGLIFAGIDALRLGLAGFEGALRPELLPGPGLLGRLKLVVLGMALTLVTQSSSAGVASALAALSAGAIDFEQAAAMVIGMDVGTTFTAALATLGASLPARRTGWAHVIYNVLTATAAFVMLPFFARGLEALAPGATSGQPELALVAFHTLFNTAGILLVLPVARPFGRLVEYLVPDRPGPFTERLDRRLLDEPEVALRAVAPTLVELGGHGLENLGEQLQGRDVGDRINLLQLAVDEVQLYLGAMPPSEPGRAGAERRVATTHVIDQLRRLLGREAEPRASELASDPRLARAAEQVLTALPSRADGDEELLAAACRELGAERPAFRDAVAAEAARGQIEASEALARMDAWRWLERTAHHAWRVIHHLRRMQQELPEPEPEPPEPE